MRHRNTAVRSVLADRLSVVALLLGVMLALVACATTIPTPRTITDLKQIAGTWHGWVGCREGCTRLSTTLNVQDDGRWAASLQFNPTYYGQFNIVNGEIRHGRDGRWPGRATLAEDGKREWLTIFHENGSLWGEFDRAK